jgi:hypothetical protein
VLGLFEKTAFERSTWHLAVIELHFKVHRLLAEACLDRVEPLSSLASGSVLLIHALSLLLVPLLARLVVAAAHTTD